MFIFCAVPGAGTVFAVDIHINQTVDHLKKQIKETKSNTLQFDADLLKLYFARDGGAWLNSSDDDIKALKRREVPDRIKNLMLEQMLLDETAKLNDDGYFGKNFSPGDHGIHVLVGMPEDPKEVLHYKIITVTTSGSVVDAANPKDEEVRLVREAPV
ncbi:hypothetical protein PF008_g2605 [Phytophthora fragariae]|uniref:Crinkler effector protein N-terminal domain-containing protein n=1 Tax=Phytophthora fragariae TaxID=53985 RepID=A0A6G0SHD2_9STRA|nr:hypothetical protein PF008_g2605 [Phytophthora fragariae]